MVFIKQVVPFKLIPVAGVNSLEKIGIFSDTRKWWQARVMPLKSTKSWSTETQDTVLDTPDEKLVRWETEQMEI